MYVRAGVPLCRHCGKDCEEELEHDEHGGHERHKADDVHAAVHFCRMMYAAPNLEYTNNYAFDG